MNSLCSLHRACNKGDTPLICPRSIPGAVQHEIILEQCCLGRWSNASSESRDGGYMASQTLACCKQFRWATPATPDCPTDPQFLQMVRPIQRQLSFFSANRRLRRCFNRLASGCFLTAVCFEFVEYECVSQGAGAIGHLAVLCGF